MIRAAEKKVGEAPADLFAECLQETLRVLSDNIYSHFLKELEAGRAKAKAAKLAEAKAESAAASGGGGGGGCCVVMRGEGRCLWARREREGVDGGGWGASTVFDPWKLCVWRRARSL